MRKTFTGVGTSDQLAVCVVGLLSSPVYLLGSNLKRIRRACCQEVTARRFALTIWMTCAIATIPTTTPLPSPATLAGPGALLATQKIDSFTRESANTFGQTNTSPDSFGLLTPSPSDLEVIARCWGAVRVHIEDAWRFAGTPRPEVVAVLDTGIDVDNPHLVGRIVGNVAVPSATAITDVYGHGTHVASTIAAIAPNSTLLSIKVADDRGFCNSADVAEGITVATNMGAAVINLSLDVEPSPALEAAIAYAWERGVVLVAAAGSPRPSDGSDSACGNFRPVYPACYPQVIAVTGIDENDNPAPLANRAAWVDVAAPGDRTYAAVPGVDYGYMTGTSTAAAHVSGLAALLCGIAEDGNGNGRTNDEVRLAIESTAEPMQLEGMGRGIVNAASAVASLSH